MTNPTTSQTPAELRDAAPGGQVTAEAPRPQTAAEPELRLPEGLIPLLPVRDSVLFPGTVLPLEVGRDRKSVV